jgi:hypothetical protein
MSKTRDRITHEITWHDARREPQCPPNPKYPDGVDILAPRHGESGFRFCKVALPYPAKRIGDQRYVLGTCSRG